MNEKTKEFIEAVEKRLSLTTGDRWDIDEQGTIVSVEPERNYPVPLDRRKNKEFIAHAKHDVPTLCAIIRAQDEELERLRALIPKPPQCWCAGSENPPAGMFGHIKYKDGGVTPLGPPHRSDCPRAQPTSP